MPDRKLRDFGSEGSPSFMDRKASAFSPGREDVKPDDVKRKLKLEYLRTRTDLQSRILEGFVQLLSHLKEGQSSLRELLQEAANLIQRQFKLRYVMIGLKSPGDGLYRYEFMAGMREDTWTAHRRKVYKAEDFALSVPGRYEAAEISPLTRVYLEEENPLGPNYIDSVNRPALLKVRRISVDQSLEADFLNTLITGPRNELLGWIEYSGTVTGQQPDSMTIRSVEVIASVLSVALRSQGRAART